MSNEEKIWNAACEKMRTEMAETLGTELPVSGSIDVKQLFKFLSQHILSYPLPTYSDYEESRIQSQN